MRQAWLGAAAVPALLLVLLAVLWRLRQHRSADSAEDFSFKPMRSAQAAVSADERAAAAHHSTTLRQRRYKLAGDRRIYPGRSRARLDRIRQRNVESGHRKGSAVGGGALTAVDRRDVDHAPQRVSGFGGGAGVGTHDSDDDISGMGRRSSETPVLLDSGVDDSSLTPAAGRRRSSGLRRRRALDTIARGEQSTPAAPAQRAVLLSDEFAANGLRKNAVVVVVGKFGRDDFIVRRTAAGADEVCVPADQLRFPD